MIDPALRKLIRRAFRTAREPDINQSVRDTLNRCWSDGKIGVAVSGMDCDCSAYGRQYMIDVANSVQALKLWLDRHYESLDGPESLTFIHPTKVNPANNWSRDLALEAFEDGHPYSVSV